MNDRNYLGIACTGHENALAIVTPSGEVVFAEAAERATQLKRAINVPADDPYRFPRLAKQYFDDTGDVVAATSWSSRAKALMAADSQKIRQALRGCRPDLYHEWIARVTFQLSLWDTFVGPNRQLAGLNVARYCQKSGRRLVRRGYDHHLTHAAYGAFTSDFDDAVVAVFDGYGEGRSYDYFHYRGQCLTPLRYPRSDKNAYGSLSSLGLFYGITICALFGFDIVNGEEWKVMGLAPYGQLNPVLYELLQQHIYVDGVDLVMDAGSPSAFRELQRFAKRPDQPYEDVADVAYTAQHHFSSLLIEIVQGLWSLGLSDNLVLTGGCALNSSFNGETTTRGPFANVYIPPAPSDDGNAVGAALLAFKQDNPERSLHLDFHSPYLGSTIDDSDLRAYLEHGSMLGIVDLPPRDVIPFVARALAEGEVVAWVQGRAEFGPRALGNRSILADPRREDVKDRINATVKFRERFRPFAPAILAEHGDEYFEDYTATPYMERTLRFRPGQGAKVPAVCHVDGTGRLQTVDRRWNPRFHELLTEFHHRTGVPVLLNTSLNVMGRPIAHSVTDAMELYLTSGLQMLVIGDHVFSKRAKDEGA